MKSKFKILAIIAVIATSALVYQGCQAVKDVTNTLANLKRLQFKLDDVNNFTINGVNISRKKSIKDFSLQEGLALTKMVTSKSFPVQFTVDVLAKNPNDGTGSTKATNANITRLDWVLYLDDVETISGVVNQNIVVPGRGSSVTIPITAQMDLYKFFGQRGYDGLINLALALGGVEGSAAKVKIKARPTISTTFGNINPGYITIVDHEWRDGEQ